MLSPPGDEKQSKSRITTDDGESEHSSNDSHSNGSDDDDYEIPPGQIQRDCDAENSSSDSLQFTQESGSPLQGKTVGGSTLPSAVVVQDMSSRSLPPVWNGPVGSLMS